MKERAELAPCPFCGGKAHTSFRSGVTGRVCRSKWFRGHIRCTSCDATGPVKTNPQEAINSWNKALRRAPTLVHDHSDGNQEDNANDARALAAEGQNGNVEGKPCVGAVPPE